MVALRSVKHCYKGRKRPAFALLFFQRERELPPSSKAMITTTSTGTFIETTISGKYVDLISPKGKSIQVTFLNGDCWVKVINASAKAYKTMSYGKRFACLENAVESYKNTDVKAALRALLCHRL
jgi:hypothetical protein